MKTKPTMTKPTTTKPTSTKTPTIAKKTTMKFAAPATTTAKPVSSRIRTIEFTKNQVINYDFSPLLNEFDSEKLPMGRRLRGMKGTLDIRIKGYGTDLEKIHHHPDVVSFFHVLHQVWPHWFFFCDLSKNCEKLLLILEGIHEGIVALATREHKLISRGKPGIKYAPDPSRMGDVLLRRCFDDFAAISRAARLSDRQKAERAVHINDCFFNRYIMPQLLAEFGCEG